MGTARLRGISGEGAEIRVFTLRGLRRLRRLGKKRKGLPGQSFSGLRRLPVGQGRPALLVEKIIAVMREN